MKLTFLTILLTLFFSQTIIAQEIEFEAPDNPAFLKWQKNNLKSEFSTGEIPLPVLANHDWLIAETQKKEQTFDTVYDLRTIGLVTEVKDQGSCGACWTFASIGSLESAFLKQNFGSFDFSEQSLRTCHGFVFGENVSCSGGNNRKATAYLTRGSGPLLESNVPYNTDSEATCDLSTKPQFKVYDINYFPNDRDIIKQALLDFGAIYTNYYNDSQYYDKTTNTYYYNGTKSTDHAVLLVGWDDNKSTLGGKGAWIIKNSWGKDWGEDGFFYIAYQDTKINTSPASFHGIETKNEGEILHMYDELGWISSLGYGNGYAMGLNKFTTSEAQTLTSIGTFATASGAVIKATVYKTKEGNFLTDPLGSTEFAYLTYAGYHRIELTEPIALEANQDFYVEVEYATSTYNYPIPFEKAKDDYASPTIEKNVAWISSSGNTWYPLGSDVAGKERDLCIRAYAKSTVSASTEIDKNDISILVYPQPTSKELTLKLDTDFMHQNLMILSVSGQLIYTQKIKNTNTKIDLSNIAQGLYLVRIENSAGYLLAQKRFIKTN